MVEEMKNNPTERFSGDGLCREYCVDRVLSFYHKNEEENKIVKSRTTWQISNLFRSHELNTLVYIHCSFLFNPKWLLLRLIFPKLVTNSSREYLDKIESLEVKCLLNLMTAKQIYNIDEIWSHYTCDFLFGDKFYHCDPFLEKCKREYPLAMGCYNLISYQEFLKKKIISILIWR
jgi:hypothetical protein